jgi:hypothetical protein
MGNSVSLSNTTPSVPYTSILQVDELIAPTGRTSNYVIATSDAPTIVKNQANETLTGVSDQTIINTALTDYKDVYIAGGRGTNVYISAPILTPDVNDFRLISHGTQIYLSNTSNCAMIQKTTQGSTNYRGIIEGFLINGNSANNATGTYGIDVTGMEAVTLRDIVVTDTKSHGVYGNAVNGVKIDQLLAQQVVGAGLYIASSAGWKSNDYTAYACTGDGLSIQQGYEHQFVNTALDQNLGIQLNIAVGVRCSFSNLWLAPKVDSSIGIYMYNARECNFNGGSIQPLDNNCIAFYFYASTGQTCVRNVINNINLCNDYAETGLFVYRQDIDGTGVIAGNKIVNCAAPTTTPYGLIYSPSTGDLQGVKVEGCPKLIVPGEVRTASGSLTAGGENTIVFSWHNPEAQDIIIKKVIVYLTTGDASAANLDVGIADDATYTNGGIEFFNDLPLETAAMYESTSNGLGGAAEGVQIVGVLCQDSASATDGWVVGKALSADASDIVGSYYIEYAGK